MNGVNQRPPAERGPGPFAGPSSYRLLCYWSLILYQLPHIKWNEQEKIPILIDENLLKTSLLRDLFSTLAWFLLFRPGESRFDMTRTPVKGISAQ
jgi:hypothetical protein